MVAIVSEELKENVIQAFLNNYNINCIELIESKGTSKQLKLLAKNLGIKIKKKLPDKKLVSKGSIIIDSILGIGLSREPEGSILEAIKWTNSFKNKAFKNRTEGWDLFKEKVLEPIVKPEVTPGEWAKRFAKGAIFNNTREMAEWLLESEDADRLPVENKWDLATNISWSLKERTKACNASFGAPPDGCAESTKREAKALTDRLDDLAMWSYTDIVKKSNSSTNSSTDPKEPEVSHQRSGLS